MNESKNLVTGVERNKKHHSFKTNYYDMKFFVCSNKKAHRGEQRKEKV